SAAPSVAALQGETEVVLACAEGGAVVGVLGDDLAFGRRSGVDLVAADDCLCAGPAHRVDVGDGVLKVGLAVARIPRVDDHGVREAAGDDDPFDGAGGRVEGERFGRHGDKDVVGDIEGGREDVLVFEAARGVDE